MKKKKKTDENEKKRISGESDDKGVFVVPEFVFRKQMQFKMFL
jgi:hypothetical protein